MPENPAPARRDALTQARANALQPEAADYIVWDATCPGFGVRVRRSGARSYVAQYKDRYRRTRRVTWPAHRFSFIEAKKRARGVLGDAAEGKDPAGDLREARAKEAGITVRALSEEWLAAIEIKPDTRATYGRNLKARILPAFGDRPAASIKREDVRRLYFEIKNEGRGILANRVYACCASLFSWARTSERIEENPAAGAIARKEKAQERADSRFLSEDEVGRFFAATRQLKAEGPGHMARMAAAFELALLVSLRPSEVKRLSWAEVDLKAGRIRWADQKAGVAPSYLSGPAVAVLAELEKTKSDSPHVFPSPISKGEPIKDFSEAWDRVCELAEFEDPKPSAKVLRKTLPSLSINWGSPIELLSKGLRHSNTATTAKHYAHIGTETIAREQEVLQRRVAALANPKAEVIEITKKQSDI